jgi:hypothetical protein
MNQKSRISLKVFMKRALVLSVGIFLVSFAFSSKKSIPHPKSGGFALIELFSSEGCSSCPPAERFMNELLKKDDSLNVYIIEFHVDYWDYLGWKDTLASNAYSQRQQNYGDQFKLSSIYTPQAIINGESEMVGSDKDKINGTIAAQLMKLPLDTILCKLAKVVNSKLEVEYTVKGNISGCQLNFAVVESNLTTTIKKGENAHLTITHNNVARVFKSIKLNSASGDITLDIPHINVSNSKLICFVQNTGNMNITVANEYRLITN